jgi:integrase/recombinase XerD
LCRVRHNHDLRHSFAVHTLIRWYQAGEDVEALLPRLSTYLGHRTPVYTYWYLSAAPELLSLAASRLEAAQETRR